MTEEVRDINQIPIPGKVRLIQMTKEKEQISFAQYVQAFLPALFLSSLLLVLIQV